MFRRYFAVIATLVLISSTALGMGSDHKKGTLPPHEGWLAGTYEAVNLPSRVHGYWINSSDTLFYRDGNAVLEDMLQRLDSIQGLTVRVILHPGKGIAKSPWSKDVMDSADWTVTISGAHAITPIQNQITVDVWLGGNISLVDLEIPSNIEVKSGDEIDAYVEKRNADGKK